MPTWLQEIGAAVVPATSQVTVCALLPAQLTAVLGVLTLNGPEVTTDCTVMSALFVLPKPGTLSRTVRRNVIVRFVVGRISPLSVVPATRFDRRGITRTPVAVGFSERMIGPLPGSVARLLFDEPVLFCSQS